MSEVAAAAQAFVATDNASRLFLFGCNHDILGKIDSILEFLAWTG